MTDYKKIFSRIESSVREMSLNQSAFDEFKNFESRHLSDNDYFKILVLIIFYSGFKAETVTNKISVIQKHFPDFITVSEYIEKDINEIINDINMIRHEKKIVSCVNNAKTIKSIVNEYNSFSNYVNSFNAKDSFENLILLKEEVEYKFDFLGGITSYHFLTDIGFPVLKPDRVITRIFKRLGLIEDEKQLLKTVIHGRKFSEATNYPIRYIDIILVKYGQLGEDKQFGLKNGICLEKSPMCNICQLNEFCYYKDK